MRHALNNVCAPSLCSLSSGPVRAFVIPPTRPRTRRRHASSTASLHAVQPPIEEPAEAQHSETQQQQQQSQETWLERTQLLVGDAGIQRLRMARVLVVGLGGVGSYAAEFLARAGVGSMVIVDNDTVDLSNTNRQLPALHSTVGMSKAHLMAERLHDINPDLALEVKQVYVTPETVMPLLKDGAIRVNEASSSHSSGSSDSSRTHRAPFDWVLDAIDSLTPKQLLLAAARALGIKVISSMGAGGRRDASRVQVGPLSSTKNDPFAANMRKDMRKCGVDLDEIACVWSDELAEPSSLAMTAEKSRFKRSYYGTISYLPAQFGLLAASTIVNDIIDGPDGKRGQQHKLYKQQRKATQAAEKASSTASQRGLGQMELKKWKARQLSQILQEHEQQQQQQQQSEVASSASSQKQPSDHVSQSSNAQSQGHHVQLQGEAGTQWSLAGSPRAPAQGLKARSHLDALQSGPDWAGEGI